MFCREKIFFFLDYPECLHDEHADYPLAPERLKIRQPMLSSYQKSSLGAKNLAKYDDDDDDDDVHDRKKDQHQKLIPNLYNKRNYIIHYRNLKQYLDLGMQLKKVTLNCDSTKKKKKVF